MAKARSKRPPQCAYKEGRARCPRNGTVETQGELPLCAAHRMLLKDQMTEDSGSALGGLLADLFTGKKITQDQVANAIRDFGAGARVRATVNGQPVGPLPQARARQPPPVDPEQARRAHEARQAALAKAKALATMRFPTGAKPTPEEIKDRKRELAKLYHPDRGGSTAAMAAINDAADVLLG